MRERRRRRRLRERRSWPRRTFVPKSGHRSRRGSRGRQTSWTGRRCSGNCGSAGFDRGAERVLDDRCAQRREAEANANAASKTDIGWGHQIRSYVLQPYQLVKDLRTGVTSTAPSDVLDGDLDRFMAAALSQRVTGEKVEVEDVE